MPGPKDLVRMRHNNVVIDIVVAVLVLALVRVIVVVSVILRSFVRCILLLLVDGVDPGPGPRSSGRVNSMVAE